MKLPRFTLRDLFWATLVVAIMCAWWLQSELAARANRQLTNDLAASRAETATAKQGLMKLAANYLLDTLPDAE